ncbi:hypothetical protein BKM05_24690 [Pseudomonas avellanae]|nr:hypothetical protein BKM05_24690 [Pseudomonas avellanae]
MHAWCRDHGLSQRKSEAASFLHNRRDDLLGQTPQTVYDIAKTAFPLLKEHFDPEFCGDYHWQLKVSQYRNRVVPTRFDFWGSLGQHAREFVCNPSVRNNYMPFVGLNQLDWTDPAIAMTLVANLSLGAPFPRGVIKCSDAFLVGRVLGDLAVAAFNAAPDREHGRKNWLFAGSLHSGKRAAAIMSLIQSARLNGHDPYAYLKDVLTRLPTQRATEIDQLLPHKWQLD